MNRDVWLASRTGRFSPWEPPVPTEYETGWTPESVALNVLEKKDIFCVYREVNHYI